MIKWFNHPLVEYPFHDTKKMSDSNDLVEQELLNLLEHLNDSMSILENLDENNRDALVDSVESIVKSFQTLHQLEDQVTGTVPQELIAQIDQGNNPDEYSKKLVEECQQSARRVEEKQRWMTSFKNHLDASIAANFSDA